MLEEFGIGLHGRAHNQRVSRFEMLGQFAVQLIGREHGPPWLLQLRNRRRRDLLRNDDFHEGPFEIAYLQTINKQLTTKRQRSDKPVASLFYTVLEWALPLGRTR